MAFKTSAELFGDGGIWGTQVPISLSSPSGPYALTNRGIGFGEQLTSAIANRSHYALGLNDDDLNTRLALFETSGLDAAYRGGASAVPGIGADITLDGKAVNTESALATMYALDESNAHWRADMTADAVQLGIGFEARGKGLAGLAHFAELDAITGVTGTALPAVLNPGGGLPTTVRITGQAPHTAGVTDLLLGQDFVFVVLGAVRRLYIITALGGPNTDITVTNVDGTNPTFAANGAATVTLYRSHFASFNGLATRSLGQRSTMLASGLAAVSDSILDLVGAGESTDLSMQTVALRTRRKSTSGGLTTALEETTLGRSERLISTSGFATQAAGDPAEAQLVQRTNIEIDADGEDYRTLEWHRGRDGISPTPPRQHLNIRSHKQQIGITGTFFSGAVIELDVPLNPFQKYLIPLAGCVVEITSSSNPATRGYYFVTAHDEPNDRFTIDWLTSVVAAAPAFAPGTTVTMTIHVISDIHDQDGHFVGNGLTFGTLGTAADYLWMSDAIAYTRQHRGFIQVFRDCDFEIWSENDSTGTEGISKQLCFTGSSSSNPTLQVRNELEVGGEVYSGSTVATGYRWFDATTGFTATPAVSHVIGFANALPDYFGGALEWVYFSRTTGSPGPLTSTANGALVSVPIWLPDGAQLISVEVTIQMGQTTGSGRSTLTTARLYLNDIDTTSTTQIGATGTAADNTTVQKITIANTNFIDSGDDEVFVVVTAGTDGAHVADKFVGVRVNFEDPGPRNF